MDKQDIAPALLGRIRADFLRLLRNAAPSAATKSEGQAVLGEDKWL